MGVVVRYVCGGAASFKGRALRVMLKKCLIYQLQMGDRYIRSSTI